MACSEQIIAPNLCSLLNHSLYIGKIPCEWKSADVTPIHKKKILKEATEKYRTIFLLPIVSEILERCAGDRFYPHLKDSISVLHHGFLLNRSCVTQLLSVLHTIDQSLDKSNQSDTIYVDGVAQALTTADHSVLLAKLRLLVEGLLI